MVSDPAKARFVAIVNLSTKPNPMTPPGDRSCNVAAGGHRSIDRESFLRCDEARLVEGTKLERLVRAGKLTSTHAASAELVGRAQAALGGSRDTKIEVTVLLRAESSIA